MNKTILFIILDRRATRVKDKVRWHALMCTTRSSENKTDIGPTQQYITTLAFMTANDFGDGQLMFSEKLGKQHRRVKG